jgi:hypothetical protein
MANHVFFIRVQFESFSNDKPILEKKEEGWISWIICLENANIL